MRFLFSFFFFFNDTATTEIYTLSLHDALPIFGIAALVTLAIVAAAPVAAGRSAAVSAPLGAIPDPAIGPLRSEEHTSELQSQSNLVCRLLLEKKKNRDGRAFPNARLLQTTPVN